MKLSIAGSWQDCIEWQHHPRGCPKTECRHYLHATDKAPRPACFAAIWDGAVRYSRVASTLGEGRREENAIMSHADIAFYLGIGRERVGQLARAGIEKLRERLEVA